MTERAMSDAQRKAVASWIGEAAPMMLLADCRITVPAEPPESGCWASTTVTHHHEAVIHVSAHLLEEPDDMIVATLAHEMCHIHHGDLKQAMAAAVSGADDTIQQFVNSTLERYIERMVDQFGRVVAGTGKLPPIDAIRAAAPAPELVAR